MFNEFELITLIVAIPLEEIEHLPELSPLREFGDGLRPGDVGTIIDIVDIPGKGRFHTVEFIVPDSFGYPVAITTVDSEKMRLATDEDLSHCRFEGYGEAIIASDPLLQELRREEEASRLSRLE